MSTWLDLIQYKGYYQSNNFIIYHSGDGSINKVDWDAYVPFGSKVDVYTSISFNGGYDFTEWKKCFKGFSIPDLSSDVKLSYIVLRYRVFMETKNLLSIPVFNGITFEFEPIVIMDNIGDTDYEPELWIQKNGTGDFTLINTSNGNEEFKFTGLVNGETVYVNNERQYIETSLPTVYRYKDFNNNYLKISRGRNVFKVRGNATFYFRNQYKFLGGH